MLEQDLDLTVSRPGNPAKEGLVPEALEVNISASGALAGGLTIGVQISISSCGSVSVGILMAAPFVPVAGPRIERRTHSQYRHR